MFSAGGERDKVAESPYGRLARTGSHLRHDSRDQPHTDWYSERAHGVWNGRYGAGHVKWDETWDWTAHGTWTETRTGPTLLLSLSLTVASRHLVLAWLTSWTLAMLFSGCCRIGAKASTVPCLRPQSPRTGRASSQPGGTGLSNSTRKIWNGAPCGIRTLREH